MSVAENVTNPETGVLIKAGDVIPVWSYDEQDGDWVIETEGTVVNGDKRIGIILQNNSLKLVEF